MKSVRVRYYAALREQRGLPLEIVDTPAETAAELYDELRARHGFRLAREHLRVALNGDITGWNSPLRADDIVEFLPPSAGG